MLQPLLEASAYIALGGVAVLIWFLALRKPKPEPTTSEKLEYALYQVSEFIEAKRHEIEVLEDLSVSLMELRDEMERQR